MVAARDLSAFQAANPVLNSDPEDFEPDGTWYSMISSGHALYPMDSNHGELDRVTPSGAISRVVDISAQKGHIVPTAIVRGGSDDSRDDSHKGAAAVGYRQWQHGQGGHGDGRGAFYIANLGVFGPEDGTVPNENVYKLTPNGKLKVRASGLEQVLGLAFRGGKLYARDEHHTRGTDPGHGRDRARACRRPGRDRRFGLIFPTGMTVGRDGAF